MWIINKILKKHKKISFCALADEWLEYKKNSIKKSTYCYYLLCIEKYLKPNLKDLNLDKTINYNNFIENLSKKFAPKTVRDITTILKSIFKYYEEEYKKKLKIKKVNVPKMEKKNLKILSDSERKKIEKYCIKNKDLKEIGIVICLNTGLRIGEICGLKWEDINLNEKVISVKRTVQRVYDENLHKTKVIVGKPKTDCSIRTIPISNKLLEVLKPIKKEYKEDCYILSGKDKCVEPRYYEYFFKTLLEKLKIKPYKFHILRHTFASKCVEIGMDTKSLSEILGHSNVNITLNIYVHSNNKIKKKYLEKL